jgi:UDP-N-acetylglucosamine 4,6-dehydratase/5-epimerase
MKSVLVTGGSGSFGQAFVKRLLSEDIERIAVLSRGEHAQAEMRERINDGRVRYFIGDVRDRTRLRRAFADVDIVVHAAALKRIEVGFYNPTEMVETNIGGAVNVIEAAMDAGVEKVVALSSDKAYQPISPYGQSKALAETMFRNAYRSADGPIFAVTRYGNVWNSRGSVVPRWREQLQSSDTVTVTNPQATRFFMRMSEAVDLVLDTIKTMKGGELNIPTLPAYRLGDLAEAMGARMNVIGLPEYEKLHESMCEGNASDKARRMTVDELREILSEGNMHSAGSNGLQTAAWKSTIAFRQLNSDRRNPTEMPMYPGNR